MSFQFRISLLRSTVLSILLLVVLALPACSHQVLTFFFTGVPEPGEERVTAAEENAIASRGRRKFVVPSQHFVHGPYGASDCEACHESLNRGIVNASAPRAISTGKPQISQRLAYPMAELCVGCHSDKQASAATAEVLWQHGPVASGKCTGCHNPHKAKRQFMLLRESNAALCGQCHSRDDLRHTPQHRLTPAAECTACHNPHAGKSWFLLKSDYDERRGLDRT